MQSRYLSSHCFEKQLDIDILLLFLFFISLIHQAAVRNSNKKGVDGGRGGNAAWLHNELFIRRSWGYSAQQRFKQCLNGDVTQIPTRTITRPLCRHAEHKSIRYTFLNKVFGSGVREHEPKLQLELLWSSISFHTGAAVFFFSLTFKFISQWNFNALINGHEFSKSFRQFVHVLLLYTTQPPTC